jgi:spore coat-associated protein N
MKKILILAIAIVLIVGAVASATWSYFSDTEDSLDSEFAAGTLNLKLSDNDETAYQDGVTASWYCTNMKPGDLCGGYVNLKNTGTIAADHVEISFANVVYNNAYPTPPALGDDSDISDSLNLTLMQYGTTNLLQQSASDIFDNDDIEAADADNDNIITLYELNGITIDNLVAPLPGGIDVVQLNMTVQLDPATGNGNQGDSVVVDITFTLNQVDTQ